MLREDEDEGWTHGVKICVFNLELFLALAAGVICLVVAIMYWLGWEMGAVEAISLSILVGSSVDYCLHLVEGYLLAGESTRSSPDHNSVREYRLV